MADIPSRMADIPAIITDLAAQIADMPTLMADLNARRWADLLSQSSQSPIQNRSKDGDSGPSSSTQRDLLKANPLADFTHHLT